MNDEIIVTNESGTESNTEEGQAETVEIVYTEQLQAIQDYQSLQIALECVLIGVLLMFSVFNILKRYI